MLRSLALILAAATLPACADTAVPNTPQPGATPPVSAPAPASGQEKTKPAAAPAASPAPKRISISQCNVAGPFVAITFDDGPHGTNTPRLLGMLKDRGIKATFFVVGQCVAEYPEITKQIVEQGHEIANHSWSHPQLTKLGEDSVRDQIGRTHNVIRQTTGVVPVLFRPPYGAFTTNQRAWAHANWSYTSILWDVDSNDWKTRNAATTTATILAQTRPGSIILCHDIHKPTIDAMPATLDGLRAKGFKFVTVSELMAMHQDKPATAPMPAKPAKTLSLKEGAGAATSLDQLKPEKP